MGSRVVCRAGILQWEEVPKVGSHDRVFVVVFSVLSVIFETNIKFLTSRYNSMKLRLGDVLIETDHIEFVERIAHHTIKIFFVSGKMLEVHCGVKSDAPATWHQDADAFIQTVQNTDAVKFFGKE